MKSKRILAVSILAILIVAGVLVSYTLADNHADQKACCGTCSSADQTAAKACGSACGGTAMATVAHATHAHDAAHAAHAHTASASVQQCPVTQFMTRLSRVDLSEAQIEKMMVIWKGTETKLLGILTPVQLAEMKEPLPLQSVMAARVAAQVVNQSQSQTACCGSCGGAQAKGCPADCTKTCCAK